MLLEAMIERGLTPRCAGQILGMTSSSRAINKFREDRRAAFALLSEEERPIRESKEKPYVEKARLRALLIISDAISLGCISTFNMRRMEDQLIAFVSQIEMPSLDDAMKLTTSADLPLPRQTYWHLE